MTDNSTASIVTRMTVTITDKGETRAVTNVQPWIDERKALLRKARDLVKDWNGQPSSLYPHHAKLAGIAQRLTQIGVIFKTYKDARNRHVDANIIALVGYFSDPKVMEGIDD